MKQALKLDLFFLTCIHKQHEGITATYMPPALTLSWWLLKTVPLFQMFYASELLCGTVEKRNIKETTQTRKDLGLIS